MIRVLTLGAVVVATTLSTGCVWPFMRGVLPENTPARALSAYAEPSSQPLGSFRNLSHPTISVNWARKKSDGQEKGDNRLTKALGINWFPVYSGAPDSLVADAQAEKQFVCGRAETAGLFIGVKPTREFDWNFLLDPDEELFVDTGTLQKSALRVAQSRALDFRKIAEKSGKWFNTQFWHWSQDSTRLLIEAEVSPPPALLQPTGPFPCLGGPCELMPVRRTQDLRLQAMRSPERLCVYGPWIQEALHGFRPEIHPAEGLVWRANDGAIHVLMLQDASNRFDVSQRNAWITTRKQGTESRATHWLQRAMVGEYTVAVPGVGADALRVEVLGQRCWGLTSSFLPPFRISGERRYRVTPWPATLRSREFFPLQVDGKPNWLCELRSGANDQARSLSTMAHTCISESPGCQCGRSLGLRAGAWGARRPVGVMHHSGQQRPRRRLRGSAA